MSLRGYIRYPAIHGDQIVFTAEDDLWLVSAAGGRAERLMAGVALATHARFSPDGASIAYTGRYEGPEEVYLLALDGDAATRLTYQGAGRVNVCTWTPDGRRILYGSNAEQASPRMRVLFSVDAAGGQPEPLRLGIAQVIAYGPGNTVVLGRNMREAAYWKRYRGGTAGHFWIDRAGSGEFTRLLDLRGDINSPCWVGDRLYFLSDHDGIGAIYSCLADGSDLRLHAHPAQTASAPYYARGLTTDGTRCVFHAGGDLFIFDPATEAITRIDVSLRSIQSQRARRFVPAKDYLDTFALHPKGTALAITTRGKAYTFGAYEGAVRQHGERDNTRYRFLAYLADGKRLIATADTGVDPRLCIFDADTMAAHRILDDVDVGHVVELQAAPHGEKVALVNHRNTILLVDAETGTAQVIAQSGGGRFPFGHTLAWSPDAQWLAFAIPINPRQTVIKLYHVPTATTTQVSDAVLRDTHPAFDPLGRYLYFLSGRTFDPVPDALQFEFSFPRAARPYLVTLRRDLYAPFDPAYPPGEEAEKAKDKDEKAEEPTPVAIDLEGITTRIVAFPVPEGRFDAIGGTADGVVFTTLPILSLRESNDGPGEAAKGRMQSYHFAKRKQDTLAEGVGSFLVNPDGKQIAYRAGDRLRVFKVGEKPAENGSARETGWIDLERVKVALQPEAEWRQMFDESWRLQREQFWTPDMSGIDWRAIHDRYAPLVARIGSRAELSDLIWEMQGELGTSHAYEIGGDYRPTPQYGQGLLGVDWRYDAEQGHYTIAHIVRGDPWKAGATSPFLAPGINVQPGDVVVAIDGQPVGGAISPAMLLVNKGDSLVQVTIHSAAGGEPRTVTVRALGSEYPARYRDWVEGNRARVHQESDGKLGYLHLPDMWTEGFAEFHRYFLAEFDYPGLVIDVRWNGGGAVSGLLLEKIARRRLGYDYERWAPPTPYPAGAPRGVLVAVTNEHAGSDGDIFSHAFKMMGLGPLIGKRTWGGVIGIEPYIPLADGTVTTQPEYSFWFKDVGWEVENYGTDPTIEVENRPQDAFQGADPQLARAIAEGLRILAEQPPEADPGPRPRLGPVGL